MTVCRFRWQVVAAFLAVCSLVLMSLVPSVSLAQTGGAATSHAQVIAQGVDLMPRARVVWRVTGSEAMPADEAGFHPRTLGFTIGLDDAFLITDGDSGANTLIDAGEAAFHKEGASERRSSTSNRDIDYVNIELIVADAVETSESLGSSDLLFAGDDFRAPRGNRDVHLTRDVLAPDENGAFAATSNSPYLLYVTNGVVHVTDETGTVSELSEGDVAEFEGDIALLPVDDQGATWMIASIGDEVELPPLPTPTTTPEADESGTLEMRLELCPDGFEEACVPTTNEEITVPAFHHVDDENWIIPDRANLTEDDTVYTYDDLPIGDYTTGPEDASQPGLRIEGATWDDELKGWVFEIVEDETTVLTLQIAPEADETGSFLVTLYDCPVRKRSTERHLAV